MKLGLILLAVFTLSPAFACDNGVCATNLPVHGRQTEKLGSVKQITDRYIVVLAQDSSFLGSGGELQPAELSERSKCLHAYRFFYIAICEGARVMNRDTDILQGSIKRLFRNGIAEVEWDMVNGKQVLQPQPSYWDISSLERL